MSGSANTSSSWMAAPANSPTKSEPTSTTEQSESLGYEIHDLDALAWDKQAFDYLQVETALKLGVYPVNFDGERLTVAISDPLDLRLQSYFDAVCDCAVTCVVVDQDQLKRALNKGETSGLLLDTITQEFTPKVVQSDENGNERVIELSAIQAQSGVTKLLNSLLMTALQKQASDIHIETNADKIDIKYRIDGMILPASESIGREVHDGLLSRLKVISGLDITERRAPQDGRLRLRFDKRDIDFRISILPTLYGEDVVIRILDKSAVASAEGHLDLRQLGFSGEDAAQLIQEIKRPSGLLLVTGPTGSGKTTTLYAALSVLTGQQEKIISIEDPIEYRVAGVTQIPVNLKKNVTFATGLRSILRHDPDKILVGEIRDLETAKIAVQAALTGHLVMATVHANSAAEVIHRFSSWGLDGGDFFSSLNFIVGQRLIRSVCAECAVEITLDTATLENLGVYRRGIGADNWVEAHGCPNCFQVGYLGRRAIVEYLAVEKDNQLNLTALDASNTVDSSSRFARRSNSIKQSALELASRGLTTISEVERVLGVL